MLLLLALDEDAQINLRTNRVLQDRLNPLDCMHVILEVIDLIEYDIKHPTRRSHAMPACIQVMCTLRYYASGNFQYANGELNGISQASVFRIVTCVSTSLAN